MRYVKAFNIVCIVPLSLPPSLPFFFPLFLPSGAKKNMELLTTIFSPCLSSLLMDVDCEEILSPKEILSFKGH